MQNKIWKPWKSKFTPDLAYAPSKPINQYFLFQGCQILNTRVTISQVNLKCYKNQILEEFCLTYFSFFLTVYCWSTYYTTYYQELFQLCNKWATYTGGAWPWMQFSTYLGYFPSFSAPKCRKVLSENSCHGVCSSNRNCPLKKYFETVVDIIEK